jgi:DGQHR domain-containing protein
MAAKHPTKKPPKLTPQEKINKKITSDHKAAVRSVFRNLGFDRIPEISDKEIEFGGQKGDFDDAYILDNLLILIEYTTHASEYVKEHLKNKKIIFSNVLADTKGFLNYCKGRWPTLGPVIGENVHIDKYIIRIVYCSRNSYDEAIQNVVNEPFYLDYPILKYFEKLTNIIRMSALGEMFNFLNVEPSDVARNGKFPSKTGSNTYEGSILPESHSGFPSGYKIVSFYVDAAALLARTYVLRRDGWRGSLQAYQRMVHATKIESIRKKLKNDHRVFVNNIIATLPPSVKPEGEDGVTIDIKTLTSTAPVRIRLPLVANSIGLIDGQHRLYSYYESRDDDKEIAKLRDQQNLLVTGIIYPSNVEKAARERFEAALFLSINANQTNAPTALRQEIEVFLTPYSPTAIGRQVMQKLAKSGPLSGHVEQYFFDKNKLKTSSIVSFGLGPLIKLGGNDSLFKIFHHPDKNKIESGKSDEALEAYLQFATSKINIFLGAVRANVESARWTPDARVKSRILTVTYINSFLITLRRLVEAEVDIEFEGMKKSLEKIGEFKFKEYHSSQYARMATKIYETYFL